MYLCRNSWMCKNARITFDTVTMALTPEDGDSSSSMTTNISSQSEEDYYYYDYYNYNVTDEDKFTCKIYDFAIETLLMGFLCVFGFVGNSLSTICLLRDGSKSATPFLLVSLQFADTLFLIAVVWLRVITTVEQTFWVEPVCNGYLSAYIGKYAFPCAMVAETGKFIAHSFSVVAFFVF